MKKNRTPTTTSRECTPASPNHQATKGQKMKCKACELAEEYSHNIREATGDDGLCDKHREELADDRRNNAENHGI